jgi:1-pyrroline-5-carboxylate dehydrogenase
MEALGEVQETADFFNVYCDSFEQPGRIRSRAAERSAAERRVAQSQRDEAVRRVGRHQSVQLSVRARRGPVAAALVTGNTVVLKGASETPWAGRLLADCLRDAGIRRASSTI